MRLILGLMGVFIATTTYANETRLSTLRQPTGIQDETQTFTYPGMVNQYSLALIELGTRNYTEVYGGAFAQFDKNAMGAVVSRDQSLWTATTNTSLSLVDEFLSKTASNASGDSSQAILPLPESPLEIFYGRGSRKSGWGVRLITATYGDKATNKATDDTEKNEASQLDIVLGYSTFGADRLDLSLGLGLMGELAFESSGTTEAKYKLERKTDLTLAARKFFSQGKGHLFLSGQGWIRSPKLTTELGAVDESKNFSETIIVLDGGYLSRPAKDVLINLSADLGYITSKGPIVTADTGIGSNSGNAALPSTLDSTTVDQSVSRTTNWLGTSIGVEAPVYGSLGMLGGMSYVVYGSLKEDDEINETETEVSISGTSDQILWSLGLFFEQDALRVDASYEKTFLHDGPYFVSGNTTSPLLTQISVTYQL